MRRIVPIACLILAISMLPPSVYSGPKEDDPLDTLIARADAAGHRDNQDELYAEVVRHEIEVANTLFAAGDADKAHGTVKNVVVHAEKSLEAARRTRKKLKETEISLRKAARRLDDVAHTLAAEDQPDVKAAVARLEEIRSELLNIMFAPPEKRDKKD